MPTFWNQAARAAAEHHRGEVAPLPVERRSIRRDPPCRTAPPPPTDDALRLRIAEELEYARRMLDVMGGELTADALMVARHARALQTIDIAGQMLGHLAAVIRSSDPSEAVGHIGMAELRARLTRKTL